MAASHRRRFLGLSMLLLSPISAQSAGSNELGQRLYREGVGVDGKPVAAVVQGDVPVDGSQLACVGCHKRSGLGASEGGARAIPVTAAVLFGPAPAQPSNLLRRRVPYDEQSLRVAVTAGRDTQGRTFDALMPRYRLGDDDLAALTAYLKVLGADPAPGVSRDELELATIVSEDAPPADREAVTTVVQQFATFKNGVTRNEQRRADASRRHLYGERHARAFRSWHVSVWTLKGPPSSWPAQLDALYAQRPPFAVVSGAAGQHWSVVDDFCERKELPCVLPVTDMPRVATGSFYNLHYSEGVRLDARVTASSLALGREAGTARIVLAYTDDAKGRAAVDAFMGAWPGATRPTAIPVPVTSDAANSQRFWRDVMTREDPDVLVAWVPSAQLGPLFTAMAGARLPSQIYTADAFTDWTALRAPPDIEQRVLHVYPYSLPSSGLAQFPREQVWLRSQGLSGLETRAAAQALFACHAVGEAMLDMADNYSREYLMETLEHMLDGTSMTTIYPVTTLGTGQRFLVKGAYVARLGPTQDGPRYVSSGWIQP